MLCAAVQEVFFRVAASDAVTGEDASKHGGTSFDAIAASSIDISSGPRGLNPLDTVKKNVLPCPVSEVTQILPPQHSTIRLTRVRPTPVLSNASRGASV